MLKAHLEGVFEPDERVDGDPENTFAKGRPAGVPADFNVVSGEDLPGQRRILIDEDRRGAGELVAGGIGDPPVVFNFGPGHEQVADVPGVAGRQAGSDGQVFGAGEGAQGAVGEAVEDRGGDRVGPVPGCVEGEKNLAAEIDLDIASRAFEFGGVGQRRRGQRLRQAQGEQAAEAQEAHLAGRGIG